MADGCDKILFEAKDFHVFGGVGVGEDGARLFDKLMGAEVAGREVGEDELVGMSFFGNGGGLGGGEVKVLASEVFVLVEVGAFAEEEFGVFCNVEGALAEAGIADVDDSVALADVAHIVESDGVVVDVK